MNYEDYLKSKDWQEKRKARLILDQNRCRLCDSCIELEVHHRPSSYVKIPNESVEDDLVIVCSRCHDFITNAIREDRYGLRETGEPILFINNIEARQEIRHGMESSKLQTEFVSSADNAQRPDVRSTQQVDKIDETDFIQKEENRCRF